MIVTCRMNEKGRGRVAEWRSVTTRQFTKTERISGGGGVQSHESSPGSHDLGRLELMHIWANYDGTYLFSVVMV